MFYPVAVILEPQGILRQDVNIVVCQSLLAIITLLLIELLLNVKK